MNKKQLELEYWLVENRLRSTPKWRFLERARLKNRLETIENALTCYECGLDHTRIEQ